jgi:hypothetical protein
MAALPTASRVQIWRGLMRFWSELRETVTTVTKSDLQAAVNAADDWVDANAASFNTALPATFRANASTSQKSLLLVAVVLMRFNVELLKRVFGEVD